MLITDVRVKLLTVAFVRGGRDISMTKYEVSDTGRPFPSKGKRRKQYSNYTYHPDGSVGSRNCMHRGRQHQGRNHLITHFVIQLERVAGDVPNGAEQDFLSCASLPVDQNEASRDEDPLLPGIEDHDADVDDVTESTESKDPVVVIG